MKLSVETWYEDQDGQGNSIACLRFEMRTASVEERNRIREEIMRILAPKPETPAEKQSAIGFTQYPE